MSSRFFGVEGGIDAGGGIDVGGGLGSTGAEGSTGSRNVDTVVSVGEAGFNNSAMSISAIDTVVEHECGLFAYKIVWGGSKNLLEGGVGCRDARIPAALARLQVTCWIRSRLDYACHVARLTSATGTPPLLGRSFNKKGVPKCSIFHTTPLR